MRHVALPVALGGLLVAVSGLVCLQVPADGPFDEESAPQEHALAELVGHIELEGRPGRADGVTIELRGEDREGNPRGPFSAGPTGPDGRFALRGLRPGRYELAATRPYYGALARQSVELGFATRTALDGLRMIRERSAVTGVVELRASGASVGAPAAGLRVWVVSRWGLCTLAPSRPECRGCWAEEPLPFACEVAAGSRCLIERELLCPDDADAAERHLPLPSGAADDGPDAGTADLPNGATLSPEQAARLEPCARLLDECQTGCPDAGCEGSESCHLPNVMPARVTADGRFELRDLPVGRHYWLVASRPSFATRVIDLQQQEDLGNCGSWSADLGPLWVELEPTPADLRINCGRSHTSTPVVRVEALRPGGLRPAGEGSVEAAYLRLSESPSFLAGVAEEGREELYVQQGCSATTLLGCPQSYDPTLHPPAEEECASCPWPGGPDTGTALPAELVDRELSCLRFPLSLDPERDPARPASTDPEMQAPDALAAAQRSTLEGPRWIYGQLLDAFGTESTLDPATVVFDSSPPMVLGLERLRDGESVEPAGRDQRPLFYASLADGQRDSALVHLRFRPHDEQGLAPLQMALSLGPRARCRGPEPVADLQELSLPLASQGAEGCSLRPGLTEGLIELWDGAENRAALQFAVCWDEQPPPRPAVLSVLGAARHTVTDAQGVPLRDEWWLMAEDHAAGLRVQIPDQRPRCRADDAQSQDAIRLMQRFLGDPDDQASLLVDLSGGFDPAAALELQPLKLWPNDGLNVVLLYTEDEAGNRSEEEELRVTVDNGAPRLRELSCETRDPVRLIEPRLHDGQPVRFVHAGLVPGGGELLFSFAVTDNLDEGQLEYRVDLDGATCQARGPLGERRFRLGLCPGAGCDGEDLPSCSVGPGVHRGQIALRDRAGNESTWPWQLCWDDAPPPAPQVAGVAGAVRRPRPDAPEGQERFDWWLQARDYQATLDLRLSPEPAGCGFGAPDALDAVELRVHYLDDPAEPALLVHDLRSGYPPDAPFPLPLRLWPNDGSNDLVLYTVDEAGNRSADTELRIFVDNEPPELDELSCVALTDPMRAIEPRQHAGQTVLFANAQDAHGGGRLRFTFDGRDNLGRDRLSYRVELDGAVCQPEAALGDASFDVGLCAAGGCAAEPPCSVAAGLHHGLVVLQDLAGNEATRSFTVCWDDATPGLPAVNVAPGPAQGGAAPNLNPVGADWWTNGRSVTLQITPAAGQTSACFPGQPDAEWVEILSAEDPDERPRQVVAAAGARVDVPWDLWPGEGPNTIRVRAVDLAGNWSCGPCVPPAEHFSVVRVQRDTVAPVNGSVLPARRQPPPCGPAGRPGWQDVAGRFAWSCAQDAPFVLGVQDAGVARVELSTDFGWSQTLQADEGGWGEVEVPLGAADGLHQVCARWWDLAGNVSEPSCTEVLRDTEPPVLHGVQLVDPQAATEGYAKGPSVNLVVHAEPGQPWDEPLRVRLARTDQAADPTCGGLVAPDAELPLASDYLVQLDPCDGGASPEGCYRRVCAQLTDAVGHTSAVAEASIVVDVAAPDLPGITLRLGPDEVCTPLGGGRIPRSWCGPRESLPLGLDAILAGCRGGIRRIEVARTCAWLDDEHGSETMSTLGTYSCLGFHAELESPPEPGRPDEDELCCLKIRERCVPELGFVQVGFRLQDWAGNWGPTKVFVLDRYRDADDQSFRCGLPGGNAYCSLAESHVE